MAIPRTSISLSLALLRRLGWICLVVEFNLRIERPGELQDFKYKKDLAGIADILACKPGQRPLLVQTTSYPHVGDHIEKIQRAPWLDTLRDVGFDIHVHGWQRTRPFGYQIVDMTAKDEAGEWIHKRLWDSIQRSGPRSKKKPRLQTTLAF